ELVQQRQVWKCSGHDDDHDSDGRIFRGAARPWAGRGRFLARAHSAGAIQSAPLSARAAAFRRWTPDSSKRTSRRCTMTRPRGCQGSPAIRLIVRAIILGVGTGIALVAILGACATPVHPHNVAVVNLDTVAPSPPATLPPAPHVAGPIVVGMFDS